MGVLLLCGCSALDNCPDEAEHSIYADAPNAHTEALVYTSAPWEGPRNPYPPRTCLHFVHDLRATPETVTTYVSFHRTGADLSENTGNQGRIKCVDDREIVIKNDTCEDSFFIRVVAQATGSVTTGETCASFHDDACPLVE
jgi:hypothetical protein